MAIRYFSKNDALKYSSYTNGILSKKNTSISRIKQYGGDKFLYSVFTEADQKINDVLKVSQVSTKYYIYGYNDITLDVTYKSNSYNVTRKNDDNSQQIILYVTSNQKQNIRFNF